MQTLVDTREDTGATQNGELLKMGLASSRRRPSELGDLNGPHAKCRKSPITLISDVNYKFGSPQGDPQVQ